jgi:23S rRNA (cytosine1962-C5)-methyltransferase
MNPTARIILHQHKAEAVKRFHPWIFSGAIKQIEGKLDPTAMVVVADEENNGLGMGYYSDGSIAVRMLSFTKVDSLQQLFQQRIESAWRLRQTIGLTTSQKTNVFRLFNAEGDGVPGLIIDYYAGTCVLQAHHQFIYTHRQLIADALVAVLGVHLVAVYDKSDSVLERKNQGVIAKDGYLYGGATTDIVKENGYSFGIDWERGQKTGFFIDQRDNRALLSRYAAGKTVLNTFSYTAGFSVYAAGAGAALVDSVDSSERAITLAKRNMELNGFTGDNYTCHTEDVFDYLKKAQTGFYDMMVLDPPAFAKNQHSRHHAVQAYTRLNKTAFDLIRPGGIVFTFSCSQAVSTEHFEGAVTAAAIDSGRVIRILHHLTQPSDHPQSIYHTEGLYLKGLVLAIE